MTARPWILIAAYAGLVALLGAVVPRAVPVTAFVAFPAVPIALPTSPRMLTDPYLQAPGPDHVHVRWLTNYADGHHAVLLGPPVDGPGVAAQHTPPEDARVVVAETVQVPRLFEDARSAIPDPPAQGEQQRVFRHEARVDGLNPGQRRVYWVRSTPPVGPAQLSGPFTLAPAAPQNGSVTLLLTSDFQQKPNALANYAAVAARHPALDGILFAGDLVNHPRRASHYMLRHRDGWHRAEAPVPDPGLFDALQGRHRMTVPDAPFAGGALLQHAPLFPAVGNHEISGRFRLNRTPPARSDGPIDIGAMFGDPQPRWYARHLLGPGASPAQISDASHDFETYRALFRTPPGPGGAYATRIGDVFLVTLDVARIWRPWALDGRRPGRFSEPPAVVNDPANWGFGAFLFSRLDADAPQIAWLREVLASEAAQSARFRVAMLHQSAFGLGGNAVPVLADPVMELHTTGPDGEQIRTRLRLPAEAAARGRVWEREVAPRLGRLDAVRYHYPLEDDVFAGVIAPILRSGGVDLVLQGHSHVWNRFEEEGLHLLETSNVGNCFGAYWSGPDGRPWRGALRGTGGPRVQALWEAVAGGEFDARDLPRTGDPQGRQPIYPTLFNPMLRAGESDVAVPFVCSNRLSVFTILESDTGQVRSFVLDAHDPAGPVREFDRFTLGAAAGEGGVAPADGL